METFHVETFHVETFHVECLRFCLALVYEITKGLSRKICPSGRGFKQIFLDPEALLR